MKSGHRSLGDLSRRSLTGAIAALILALYFVPLLAVVLGAFRSNAPGQPGDWTLQGFIGAYTDPETYSYLGNSVMLALLAGLFATSVGVILTWISVRSTAWMRHVVTGIMLIVLATPGLFFALSWSLLGAPKTGLLNQLLGVLGFSDTLIRIEGLFGVAFVLGLKLTGLCYFMLIGAMRSADGRLEEAAQVSGASRLWTFLSVTVPVISPAIAGVLIVTMVIGMVALETPLIIGLPSGFRVFSTQIYTALNNSIPPDYTTAAALALLLVVFVLALIALKWRVLDRRSWITVGGKGASAPRWDLGRGNIVVNLFVIVFTLAAVVLPAIQLGLGSLQPLFGVNQGYSFDNYRALLQDPAVIPALRNTAFVALVGGFIAVALSLAIGVAGRHARVRVRRLFELATWMPWALNGVVLALGLTWAFLAVPFLRPAFGSVEMLMLALVIATTPLAARTIDGALAQIAPDLEESARVHGAGPMRSGFDVIFKLVLPSFIAGWLVVAIHIAGDLEVPILLSTPDSRTLSVVVYRLYGDGEAAMAAALFCILIAGAVALFAAGMALLALTRWLVAKRRAGGAPDIQAGEILPIPPSADEADAATRAKDDNTQTLAGASAHSTGDK